MYFYVPDKFRFATAAIIFVCLLSFFSCEEDDDKKPVVNETSTMMDVEGNVYKTVKIGNQWWMAENLKVTKYRNGSIISELVDSADWVSSTWGGYCLFENGDGVLKGFGNLYNWQAVNSDFQLAPEGWHIPSDQEWKQLEMALGMKSDQAELAGWRGTDEADKLKSESMDDWASFGDVFSTNESGFTAQAGSCRVENNYWGDPGIKYTAFWWSSTPFSDDEKWYRHPDYKSSQVFRSHTNSHYGFSVRCVKN